MDTRRSLHARIRNRVFQFRKEAGDGNVDASNWLANEYGSLEDAASVDDAELLEHARHSGPFVALDARRAIIAGVASGLDLTDEQVRVWKNSGSFGSSNHFYTYNVRPRGAGDVVSALIAYFDNLSEAFFMFAAARVGESMLAAGVMRNPNEIEVRVAGACLAASTLDPQFGNKVRTAVYYAGTDETQTLMSQIVLNLRRSIGVDPEAQATFNQGTLLARAAREGDGTTLDVPDRLMHYFTHVGDVITLGKPYMNLLRARSASSQQNFW
jgi:hypothetical protein